jgi:Spy/CpxP family protein refolding chaperone
MIRLTNIFILLALCRVVSLAQPDRDFQGGPGKERMMEKLESMRVAFLTNRLDLTTEESTKFWPVYNEYAKIRMELRMEIRRDERELKGKDLSDEESKKVLERQFANQEKELTLKKNYYEKFKAILPPQKLAKLEPAEMEFNHEVIREIKERKEQRRMGGPRKRN